MAFQFSVSSRNAALDALEVNMGASPTLEIRTGAPPANCGAADSGSLLASMALPADWLTAASAGQKLINGTWQDLSADAGGTAGHFRVKQGATCHIQGTITVSGGGGDMTIDNTTLTATQQINVTAFTINAGGA